MAFKKKAKYITLCNYNYFLDAFMCTQISKVCNIKKVNIFKLVTYCYSKKKKITCVAFLYDLLDQVLVFKPLINNYGGGNVNK